MIDTLADGTMPLIYLPRRLKHNDPRVETCMAIVNAIHAGIADGSIRTREDVKQWALPRGCSFSFISRRTHLSASLPVSVGATHVEFTYTIREGA